MGCLSESEPAAADQTLHRLLTDFPYGPVVAIKVDGTFVPMPASAPLTHQLVIPSQTFASALDLVVPTDAIAIIEAWAQANRSGASRVSVHLLANPEQSVMFNLVDATQCHGVFIGLFELERMDLPLMAAAESGPTLRPRVGLIRRDSMGFIVHADDAIEQILGYSHAELTGLSTLDLTDPAENSRAIGIWGDVLRAPGLRRQARIRYRRRDGTWVWFEVTSQNLLDDPAYGCVVTEMVDISEEMGAQEAVRTREHLLRRLAEALPLGVFQVDAQRNIVYSNKRLATILGKRPASSLDDQLAEVLPAHRGNLRQALDAVLLEGRDSDLEVRLRRPGKSIRRCRFNLRALTDDDGAVAGAIVCVADVTESVRMREKLEERATFDLLRRCHNRASILQILGECRPSV